MHIVALMIILAFAAAGCGALPPATAPTSHAGHGPAPLHLPRYDPSSFQAGINLLLYGAHPSYATLPNLMQRWHRWGVKDVAIAYPLFQRGVDSVDIAPGASTPTLGSLKELITRLEDGGFVVMMRPLLDEASLRPSWRGAIAPASVADWFVAYTQAVVAEARLAQELHVAQFDVGTELSSLQGDTPEWLTTLRKVRKVYHGTLLYSCNWNDTAPEPWFSELDAVGVDAYYPVDLPGNTSTVEISSSLARDAAQLPNYGKPTWITEAGLAPVAGAFEVPYNLPSPASAYAPLAQAQYYQAFCDAFTPSTHGLFWWSSDLGTGRASTQSYDPTPVAGHAMSVCFSQVKGLGKR